VRVVIDHPGAGPQDVELLINDPEATVAELVDALDDGHGARDRAPGIVLDGRFCHADLALEEIGLYEGATVRPDGPPEDVDMPARATLELRVAGGLDAGRRMPLRTGVAVTIGRDPSVDLVLSDAGVSRRHLELVAGASGTVTVTDLDSANGTWIEGRRIHEPSPLNPGDIFEAGDVALTVAVPTAPIGFDPLREVRSDGTAAFNRPPRPRRPDAGGALSLPEQPAKPEKPQFSVVAAVGPLVLGGVMVVVMKNIFFALFMVLSPILTIGGYFEQRRRAGKKALGQGREHQKELQRFEQKLSETRDDTLVRLRVQLPDVAELARRASAPEPTLWERRESDDDFLLLSAGFAKIPFTPELNRSDFRGVSEATEKTLNRFQRLPPAPVEVDLHQGGVVGIVGPREPSLAVARALLCQAATLQGPADLQIAIFADERSARDWEFAKWMPHARDLFAGGSRRLIAADRAGVESLISTLRERREADPRTLLAVLDSPELIEGRGAPGRTLMRDGQVSGIILASTPERLPANCTTVIELNPDTAEARVIRPQRGEIVDPVLVSGFSAATATACARSLARFDDADLNLEGGTLPTDVELLPLLGLGEVSAAALSDRWSESFLQSGLSATFAVDRDGPFSVDLVRDGPHGLIAGTTGSGKSEMLRSLVASLAAGYSPERLNFVLIDYKGGSAFARCAELPHTVGMVTDLDEQLGSRALTSMEAELRFRERFLRRYAADDLIALDRLVVAGQAEPLPRLVVIIDEFATLAAELPDFMTSLVGIAQRGRSLGVHLLLATQRPAGAVNDNIRANTNVRICLRVQTAQDSTDVLDDRAAASISRIQPGRAYVRLGPSEIDPIQTALVTGPALAAELAAVRVRPFAPLAETRIQATAGDDGKAGPGESSLDLLVAAAAEAHADAPPARRPWLEPLALVVELEQMFAELREAGEGARLLPFAGEGGFTIPLALLDDPAAQAQYPAGWNLEAGNLLISGIGGSGTTTALRTLAISLAMLTDPDRCHIYAMDFGAGELAALTELPHVGAVIAASEHERQVRLIRTLRAELIARREHGLEGRPRIVLMLDGYAGFAAEHSDLAGDAVREEFARLWSDGPELGIHLVVATDRPGAMPNALVSLAQQRLVLALADQADYAQFGIRRGQLPRFSPGRGLLAGSSPMVLQVAQAKTPIPAIAELIRGRGELTNPPREIGVLPRQVTVSELLDRAGTPESSDGVLWLPAAIEDGDLAPAGWSLYPGEHALISGPARTGRTSTLIAIAQIAAALYPGVEIAVIAPPRSGLLKVPGLWGRASNGPEITELVAALKAPADAPPRRLLLIDDADSVEDPGMALAGLLSDRQAHYSVIAAGRPETFRSLGHWSVGLRASRNGLLLAPDPNLDGAPLGIALPRRPAPPTRPGCGYLVVAGSLVLAQAALPEAAVTAR
jgi:S-DNA-T family DNA segregation ATPase FtsK/SpoIIIE